MSFNGVNYNCICSPEAPEYHCPRRWCAVECTVRRDGSAQAFPVDVRPDAPLSPFHEGHYWFDCKTYHLPYDPVVMMAMIALKHHLGDSVVMRSKGRWEGERGVYCRRTDGPRWEGRDHPNAIEVYEHVFVGRAPVRNILEETPVDHNRQVGPLALHDGLRESRVRPDARFRVSDCTALSVRKPSTYLAPDRTPWLAPTRAGPASILLASEMVWFRPG